MPIATKGWQDLPPELAPEPGEPVAAWLDRITAFEDANPGELTPVDAPALIDLEARMGAYADTQLAAAEAFVTSMFGSHVPVYNVLDYPGVDPTGATDSWAGIQQALDDANKYNRTTDTYVAGQRGGVVFFPLGTYKVLKSLYTDARIRMVGQIGISAGGKTSQIVADPAGDYTNGAYSEKFLLKVGNRNTGTYWWHSGSLELLKLDCAQVPGLAGFHCWESGENSLVSRVYVTNTGWTDRTVNDVSFSADSKVINSATAAFTQDDVRGTVTLNDATGFPAAWADETATDCVITKGSDIITSPSGQMTATMKGKEWAAGGQGMYVKAYIDANTIRMSDPMTFSQNPRSITFTQPRTLRIERVVNATTAWLTREALTTGAGGSVTLRRGRPAVQYHGGGATMHIDNLAVFENSGHGLEIISGKSGFINVQGDNNGGALVRFRDCGASADCGTYELGVKSENNDYGAGDYSHYSRHEPPILMDGCGPIHVNLTGSVTAGDRGTRAVVQISRKAGFSAGLPSVTLNLTGSNPYNAEFRYGIYDADTGRHVDTPVLQDTNGGQMFPLVLWNRPIIAAGDYGDTFNVDDFVGNVRRTIGTNIPTQRAGTEPWRVSIPFWNQPNLFTSAGGGSFWNASYQGTAINTVIGYNGNGVQNDDARWYLNLSKGTWRLDLNGYKGTDRGVTTWDISFDAGVTWTTIGTVDEYAAAAIQSANFTNIVVPSSGRAILRARVLTKNAASSGYLMVWSQAEFIRTA